MGFGSRLRSAWQPALVVLSVFLLVGGSFWGLLAVSVGQLLAALVVLTVSVLVVVRLSGGEASDGTESSWNAIPNWQYDGRHVESGGLTRGEQEQALEEIHDEAAKRHDEHHHRK
ncbi:MAG: hypothetical protein R6V31_03355 [Halohasta sp.]